MHLSYGGSLSGEHGDGQAKGELLPRMFGAELIEAFREFKAIWDPHWRMNPGKVIDAYPLDTNLRLGPDYTTRRVKTYFHYPDDSGSSRTRPSAVSASENAAAIGARRCARAFRRRARRCTRRAAARTCFSRCCAATASRRLARSACARGARSLPAMQGLQARLPGQRRYGDLQGGVSRALLPGPAAAARGVRDGPGVSLVAMAKLAPGFANVALGLQPLRWLAGFAPQRDPPESRPNRSRNGGAGGPLHHPRQASSRRSFGLTPSTTHFLPGTAKAAAAVSKTLVIA